MTAELNSLHLDLFPDAAIFVGADGVIQAANGLAARLVHAPLGELIGQQAHKALPLREPGGTDWWECSAGFDADPVLLPRIPERQLQLVPSGGTARPVTVTGRRIAAGDGSLAGLSIGIRRAGRQLDLERRRSDLISTASHELRGPLTSVRGFTKTLLARWDRFDDATRKQMLATIDEDANRVTRLLTELLDVSRIEAGRLPLRRRIAALSTIIEPVARRFEAEHRERDLIIDVPDDLPDLVVDPARIDQVFVNLIDNAVKYGSGTVSVSAREDGDMVVCTVADKGGDVPNMQLEQLFDKYYRPKNTRGSGSGLGLYICRGIVTAHGGRIWARSSKSTGTQFVFTLPSVRAHLGEPTV
jgi:signal transduction histidine kinase